MEKVKQVGVHVPLVPLCSYASDYYDNARSKSEIAETARYYYKNPNEWTEYNLGSNNCEHFASFCATGKKRSGQVQTAVAIGTLSVFGGILVGAALLGTQNSGKDASDSD